MIDASPRRLPGLITKSCPMQISGKADPKGFLRPLLSIKSNIADESLSVEGERGGLRYVLYLAETKVEGRNDNEHI